MTITEEMVVLNEMVEEVNDNYYKQVEAYEEDGYLFLQVLTVRPNSDTEALEDALYDVIEGLRSDFDVDFDIEYMKGRTMVLSVLFA